MSTTTTAPAPAAPASDATATRRLPIGAEPLPDGSTHVRVWAPARRAVDLVVYDAAGTRVLRTEPLAREAEGYWSAAVRDVPAGTRYKLRLDGGDALPDPASRFQPDGPHGASAVVDPTTFRWTDAEWRGIARDAHVLYELHIGTFTREGTWRAAIEQLPALAELGVTTLEVMPLAEFAGTFNWGYDGVALFAPTHLYGGPDDVRAFVDRAHALGLAVILDVVYNHLGPDGNYLSQFSPHYFSDRHRNDWGDGLNFDGPHAAGTREFFLANARYWIDEFHMDGLRLDATQAIQDESDPHILREIGETVRDVAHGRTTYVVNENEPQRAMLVRPPDAGGCGLDAIWNDDWHHSAIVALTGRDEAYYTDYRGSAQELVSAAKHGFLFQGQWYRWQHARRGTSTRGLEPWRFVHFLQNHDQIANSGRGERLQFETSPARLRALTALLLLGPQTPMLFMGQEFAASAPFLFFADHHADLARQVATGRRAELSQFVNLADPLMDDALARPDDPATFERCKLDHGERTRHAPWWRLHRDLLALRRDDPCFGASGVPFDGAVLGEQALVLRWFAPDENDRLLVVNLGRALHLDPAPEPLLAPVEGTRWRVAWSSEDPRYGGISAAAPDAAESPRSPAQKPSVRWPRENWRFTGECALALVPDADPT